MNFYYEKIDFFSFSLVHHILNFIYEFKINQSTKVFMSREKEKNNHMLILVLMLIGTSRLFIVQILTKNNDDNTIHFNLIKYNAFFEEFICKLRARLGLN